MNEAQTRLNYILQYKNKRLAVIDAKSKGLPYTTGLRLAKSYADRINFRYTYSTNGLEIYGVDIEEGKEGDAFLEFHQYLYIKAA